MRRPFDRHESLENILAREPGLIDYWIFGFVRNPWDRMVSWWSMIDHASGEADRGNDEQISRFERYPEWAAVRGFDFESFVLRGPELYPRFAMAQSELLFSHCRRPDFVGRFEHLLDDVNVVRERIGARPRPTMPHKHKSTRRPYRGYYTRQTRDVVARDRQDLLAVRTG